MAAVEDMTVFDMVVQLVYSSVVVVGKRLHRAHEVLGKAPPAGAGDRTLVLANVPLRRRGDRERR